MSDSLATLARFGVPVNSVLDVGVQCGTQPLITVFPGVTHYLFEPVDAYFKWIRQAYSAMRYELFHVALSDADGEAWQVGISLDGSGLVTHSQLSEHEVSPEEEPRLVECKLIRKARLDSLLAGSPPSSPWLLKVDVDGHEIPILRGASQALQQASIVVIEAPLPTMLERMAVLAENGFELFDIVDLSYYHGMLSQVDLVFVRRDIVASNDDLRPWQTRSFSWEAWEPLGEDYFRARQVDQGGRSDQTPLCG